MAGISPVTTRDSVRWWFRRGRGKEAGGKGAPGSWGRFGTARYGSLNICSVQRCSFWSCSVWFQVCRICAEPGGECDFVLKYVLVISKDVTVVCRWEMSVRRWAYLFVLYSCCLSMFASSGHVSSKMWNFLLVLSKMVMSGFKFVMRISGGMVPPPSRLVTR